MKWEILSDEICELGEGPLWDRKKQRIIWLDIEAKNIHQYYFPGNRKETFHLNQKIGSVCLSTSPYLVGALQNGFAKIDTDKKTLEMIADPERHLPGNRFNDGKCDPAGRFWAGTMGLPGKTKSGSLYTLEKDLSVSIKIKNVGCSNGMAWSTDHTVFYFIDTATRQVVAYDYDISDGSIHNKRIIISFTAENGLPDGMTIDSEGMLWIALWGTGKIERWDPNKKRLLDQLFLPVSQVTSCIFGGENLNDLYITTAKCGLEEKQLKDQPLAGALFVFKDCGYCGLPAFEFEEI